jgi:serine/threonine protein kinase
MNSEEPKTFNDIFEIVECLDDTILCKLTGRKTLYEARKIYIDKSNGVCKDGWIIDDENNLDNLGEASGNATIFTSQCKGNDKQYVAKFIKIDHLFTVKSAMNEILIQNKVYSRFGNITIPIYQAFVDKNNAYVILMMDFIPGLTVRRYIQENINDIDKMIDIINIVVHCKKLVKFLFYKGLIIHGDAHLNNFMFIPGDTIKMIDFGAGKEIITLTKKEFMGFRKMPFLFQRQFEQSIKDASDFYQKDLHTIDEDISMHIDGSNHIIHHIIERSNQILKSYIPDDNPPVLTL